MTIPGEAIELEGSNVQCETIVVRAPAGMSQAGLPIPGLLASIFFYAGGPLTISKYAVLDPVNVGVGMWDLYWDGTAESPAPPGIGFSAAYIAFDGLPGLVSIIPGSGLPGPLATIILSDTAGVLSDVNGFSLTVWRTPTT